MTSPFCLHFNHVLFFEILLPVCRSSLLISYCLLKQLVMRICIYVLSDIFSPYFSLSGKMPSSIKTNIKSASGSMHPYNRWAPLFFLFHHSSFVSFQRLASGNNIYNLCDLLHEAIIFMELPNFYEVISLLSICFTDILVFHFMI